MERRYNINGPNEEDPDLDEENSGDELDTSELGRLQEL